MSSDSHTDPKFKEKKKPKNPISFKIPLNDEQKEAKAKILTSAISVIDAKAGSGKTLVATQIALDLLFTKQVEQIIIARPFVTAGEDIGFLPGGVDQKLEFLTFPIYDIMESLVGNKEKIQGLTKENQIKVIPIGFLRGHAQSLDCKIYTPNGFKFMGDLKIGDEVFNECGEKTIIKNIYPQGYKDIYKITFSDGSETECCDEHLWNIKKNTANQLKNKWITKSLKEFKEDIKYKKQNKWIIPVLNNPVDFNPQVVEIDPYTLGCLLGDGCITGDCSVSFSTNDIEILDYIKLPINYNIVKNKGDNYDYRFVSDDRKPILNEYLKNLGLYGTKSYTKFIPQIYKYNDVNTRIELLRGLLDTDGDIGNHPKSTTNRVQFNSTSLRLIEDVVEIVNSLGGITTSPKILKSRISYLKDKIIKSKHICYRINIILPINLNPFKLKRKSDLFLHPTRLYRTIKNVEYVGKKESQCISIDSPSQLYLTDNFIVTHNTFTNSVIIIDEAQNCTKQQTELILGRLGLNSKLIFCGDKAQCDLKNKLDSGLNLLHNLSKNVENISYIKLIQNHRHKIVDDIFNYIRDNNL